ncbi:MAG: phosphate ABC transporter permease PstA [Ghiorsea sp.]|nr:phosphate ABC transporter permease PstA [Ghiorsea sp.]MDQ6981051.1 phosphate ABC transporter permease PstA [Ghiorsea sp.]MDQ7058728.1 phosphate ABC transporter permease PstA [Ghiorsea sp.]
MSKQVLANMKTNKRLRKRYRKEKLFKGSAIFALSLAAAFLVFFFYNIINQGYSALVQAQILVDVQYNEASHKSYRKAIDKSYRKIVSRGWLRTLPIYMEDHPEVMNTVRNEWVVATADVDQYLKGKSNRLKDKQKRQIDKLQEEGKVKLSFNSNFFTNGDSKMAELAGIKSALVGSIYVLIVTLLVALPIGVMTAIYLEEFAPDNRLTQVIEVNINNLAAIPSILFGLLGLAIFINFFGVPRSSALVGGLTLALMTLPVIIITTRAALRAVPHTIREAAYGLGASKWQTVWHHTLPLALPGILTGSIIGLAQAMGETAPLLIIGMMAYIPDTPTGFTEVATVLPAQIFTWAGESIRAYEERTAAAILVLLSLLLSMNSLAVWLRKRFETRW